VAIDQYLEKEWQGSALTVSHSGWDACRPGYAFGPAMRDHFLIHFVVRGKGIYRYRQKEYHLSAGQGFLIFPGERTYYQADAKDPWEYIWVGFGGYEARKLVTDCGLQEHRPIFTANDPKALETALFRLAEELQQPSGTYAVLARFYRVASLLEQSYDKKTGGANYVQQAMDYIHRNYSYNLQIGDLARQIGIDRTYLYKLFCREAGCSPQEYLIDYRLRIACGLLQNTALSATEIALSCGFLDVPSFYKQFQRRYQQTPLNFRRKMQGKPLDESEKL